MNRRFNNGFPMGGREGEIERASVCGAFLH